MDVEADVDVGALVDAVVAGVAIAAVNAAVAAAADDDDAA